MVWDDSRRLRAPEGGIVEAEHVGAGRHAVVILTRVQLIGRCVVEMEALEIHLKIVREVLVLRRGITAVGRWTVRSGGWRRQARRSEVIAHHRTGIFRMIAVRSHVVGNESGPSRILWVGMG